jgi:hypothetical protein
MPASAPAGARKWHLPVVIGVSSDSNGQVEAVIDQTHIDGVSPLCEMLEMPRRVRDGINR